MICSQYTTVRQWLPVCNMVLRWGDRGLEAVKSFEKVEKRGLSVHTFRQLASVVDPDFLEPVLTVMRSSRPTIGQFSQAVFRACKEQWYTWMIMHPELPIHASRSVFPSA